MKKYRMHFISVIIIVIMLVFAISTTIATNAELTLINNSSKNLKIKITRQGNSNNSKYEYYEVEEITLLVGEDISVKKFLSGNAIPSPDRYIINIIIFNENGEIIKEYDKISNNEEFKLLFNLKKEKGNTGYYTLVITDELLK